MAKNRPRSDMPLHLPESFTNEAEQLRNKLLMFRFQNLKRYSINETTQGSLEPRISQIFAPLLTLVADETERASILDLIRDYSDDLSMDRSTNIETYVVEAIRDLWTGKALPLKAVTARVNQRYAEEFNETVSGKKIGFVIGKQLKIRTMRKAGIYEIPTIEKERIRSLLERFGS
jgi:hypothetical protein